ncbi:hypothetical protein HYPSUDRAFT_52001 [Hypholoma sublateritium FD-334 SS-4]|uniref:Uncharacterized protein n=1 Tax=Hypholoma sublateritium (strain FD-334 SS-4) TaxID=945553 RepID=A0A0D2Q6W4_HYPSF|nr:hypothetical protein HYPSUDRAFT_52001 [Hypholoma sublateritium FD-334 SS-4]
MVLSPPPRLASPFHLGPPPVSRVPRRRARPNTAQVCTPVSSRTRSKAASRRRRLPAFDSLPWISTLDAPPELLNPWDIADLSLIADAALCAPPGPGPVRRRKTSLRSCPITPTKPRETSAQSVSTPPSRFIPSRVLFHNLMPVVDYRAEHPHSCINSSRINL